MNKFICVCMPVFFVRVYFVEIANELCGFFIIILTLNPVKGGDSFLDPLILITKCYICTSILNDFFPSSKYVN